MAGQRKGRSERRAARAIPAAAPCPPGQRGGSYRPLSESDIGAIHAAALALLARTGMGAVPDRLAADLLAAGAEQLGNGRIGFPAALVEDAIAAAPKRFTLHGRDPERSIELGGDRVWFGTGGAAVEVLDLETGSYRAATLDDLHAFARLQDALDNISWFTRPVIATDLADPFALDLNTAFALLRNTTKPVGTAFTLAEHVAPIVGLFDMAAGGEGRFARRPFVKAHVSPVISPLRYGADAVAVVYECTRHRIPLSCITAAQAGATAPAAPAAALALSLAETLASLVMVHAIRPGHPMIFSNWPFVSDLRSGAFTGGGPETALLNAASAQITNWLGLVSGVAAGMTDSKLPDAQYGAEKGLSLIAAGLAGANLVYESAGMTASLMGASYEGMVLDDEILANCARVLRGVEVTAEALDTDAIARAVLGEGHFLGAPETLAAMRRDYLYPALADRASPTLWALGGAGDARSRARARARAILDSHHPDLLGREQEAAIRAAFPGIV